MIKQETPNKVEWWYDDAMFYKDRHTLPLACLRTFGDGSAEVLFDQSKQNFASAEDARDFLLEDEYLRLTNLADEYGLLIKIPPYK